jgi:hypothetical protein
MQLICICWESVPPFTTKEWKVQDVTIVGVKTGRCLGEWNISTSVILTRMEKMTYKEVNSLNHHPSSY